MPDPAPENAAGADDAAVERLRALLRVPTVTPGGDGHDPDAFEQFRRALKAAYPALHGALSRIELDAPVLLLRWAGREPDAADAPVVLMAHLDVVPVAGQHWTHPPFDAELTDDDGGTVWARGALDDKGVLVSLCEAVERAAAAGAQPRRDLFLCFGGDEESTGRGAAAAADWFERQGRTPALVIDEGGAVVRDVLPGIDRELAVIGLGEKGTMTVDLIVDESGGHAATPPADPATARLGRAVARIAAHPFPPRLGEVELQMLEAVATVATSPVRALYRQARTLAPVLGRLLPLAGPEAAALVRTTSVVTRLSGSPADNVLAARATATVNLRIAVGSSTAEALVRLRRVVRDERVRFEVRSATEPSPVSRTDDAAWRLLTGVVGSAFPEAVAVPYTMLQASDSRFFARRSANVYRFMPFDLRRDERESIHGADERIRLSTFRRATAFWVSMMSALEAF